LVEVRHNSETVLQTVVVGRSKERGDKLLAPEELRRQRGIRKYGFHGTSRGYVSGVASDLLGGDPHTHRVITLHLGNGSSATAIRGGQSMDTSMSFTPTAGLVMGTRPGDVDPAVVTFLLEHGDTLPLRSTQCSTVTAG